LYLSEGKGGKKERIGRREKGSEGRKLEREEKGQGKGGKGKRERKERRGKEKEHFPTFYFTI